jgi:hypothetical protein
MIRQFEDSRIRQFEDSRIRQFEDSRIRQFYFQSWRHQTKVIKRFIIGYLVVLQKD